MVEQILRKAACQGNAASPMTDGVGSSGSTEPTTASTAIPSAFALSQSDDAGDVPSEQCGARGRVAYPDAAASILRSATPNRAVFAHTGRRRRPVPVSAVAVAAVALGSMLWIGDRTERSTGPVMPAATAESPAMGERSGSRATLAPAPDARLAMAPDFSQYGFHLSNVQVVKSDPHDAFTLSYEHDDGHRIDLYAVTGREFAMMDAPATPGNAPVSLVIWSDPERSYLLVGSGERETLLSLSKIASSTWARTHAAAVCELTADPTRVC